MAPAAVMLDAQTGLPAVGEVPAPRLWHSTSIDNHAAIDADGLQPHRGYISFSLHRSYAERHGLAHAWREFCGQRPAQVAMFSTGLDDLLAMDVAVCAESRDEVLLEVRSFEPVPAAALSSEVVVYDLGDRELYVEGMVGWLTDSARWVPWTRRRTPYHQTVELHAASGSHQDIDVAEVAVRGLPASKARRLLPAIRARGLPVPPFPPALGVRDGSVEVGGHQVPFMRCEAL